MYPTSENFLEKISAPVRDVVALVEIDYTDPFLDQTITVEANELANVSRPEQTADSLRKPTAKIASLDGSWVLDDTFKLAEQFDQIGWWGEQLSDANGLFVAPLPRLTVKFNPRPVTKLSVVGDDARKEYPVNFTIYAYSGELLVHTEVVTDNKLIEWNKELQHSIPNCTSMVLEVSKWNKASRQVKVVEFFTSIREAYYKEDIVSLSLLEEMTSSSNLAIGTVTSSELTLSLRNDISNDRKFDAGNTRSPLHNLLRPNRRIRAWIGIEGEMVPLGIFWSGDWSAPEDRVEAMTIGLDKLKFLSGTTFNMDSVVSNITLYDFTEMVLIDAGLTSGEYYIDEALLDIILPNAFLQDVSHREALRLIAEVSAGNVYCNRDGVVVVEGVQRVIDRYTVSVSEKANVSYENQLVDGIESMDAALASLDGSWSLDVDYELAPSEEGPQVGWWGEQLSDANGNFSNPFPKATLVFQKKAIGSVKIVGDDKRGEYPVAFNIRIFDSENNIVSNVSVTNNNSVSVDVKTPGNPTNAVRLEVEILKWSHPNRQVKLAELIDIKPMLYISPALYIRKDNPIKYSDLINIVEVEYVVMDNNGNITETKKVILSDEDSVRDNGPSRYQLRGNNLIQTAQDANRIGELILSLYKDPSRDLQLHWAANPAVMLRDTVTLRDSREGNNYVVVSQELDYDGSLRGRLYGRRVIS